MSLTTGNSQIDALIYLGLFLVLFGSVAVFIINRMFSESFEEPKDKI